MLGFLSFDREAEQYLCAAVAAAREGSGRQRDPRAAVSAAPAAAGGVSAGAVSRSADGGFATPEIFDFLDAEPRLDYVVAMAKNAVLQRHAESAMQVARAQSEGRWRDRARLYRHPLRRPHVGPRAPGRDQGRSRSPRRPRAAGQPAGSW